MGSQVTDSNPKNVLETPVIEISWVYLTAQMESLNKVSLSKKAEMYQFSLAGQNLTKAKM